MLDTTVWSERAQDTGPRCFSLRLSTPGVSGCSSLLSLWYSYEVGSGPAVSVAKPLSWQDCAFISTDHFDQVSVDSKTQSFAQITFPPPGAVRGQGVLVVPQWSITTPRLMSSFIYPTGITKQNKSKNLTSKASASVVWNNPLQPHNYFKNLAIYLDFDTFRMISWSRDACWGQSRTRVP